jgi:hypothetical protein
MRAQDRTYLQQLGFSDADRANELHNACCLYLAQPDKAAKIFRAKNLVTKIEKNFGEWRPIEGSGYGWSNGTNPKTVSVRNEHGVVSTRFEIRSSPFLKINGYRYKINKTINHETDSGYKRTIGYADLMITCSYTEGSIHEYRCVNEPEVLAAIELSEQSDDSWVKRNVLGARVGLTEMFKETQNSSLYDRERNFLIEVKKGYTDVTSVIQQINTYREYSNADYYYLCTMYKIDQLYKNTLDDHKINHIYVTEESVRDFLAAQKESPSEEF